MPGGGVDEENAALIVKVTGAKDIHGSFSYLQPSRMQFLHPKVHFSSNKKTLSLHSRAGMMQARRALHVPRREEGEDENKETLEYSQEDLAEIWGRRVASEEKIKLARAALEKLSNSLLADEGEQQMD